MNTKVKLPRCLVLLMSVLGLLTATSAADFFEDFTAPPSGSDWKIHGDTNLFHWNPAGHLDVTWDSTQTNSYFLFPLHSVLGKQDDFKIEFELTLNSIGYEANSGPLIPFEIALGFINVTDATHTNFFRGKGTGNVRNLVEFNYFPDTGYGDTIWPSFWSTNSSLSYVDQYDYTLVSLPLSTVFHVAMDYNSTNETLSTTITADGEPFGPINSLTLAESFTDFRVDTFAICSYELLSNNSLHAQGTIDNIRLTFPRPVADLAIHNEEENWTATFLSRTNWTYQLEEATTLNTWSVTGELVEGTGETVDLPLAGSSSKVFTRVRATRK